MTTNAAADPRAAITRAGLPRPYRPGVIVNQTDPTADRDFWKRQYDTEHARHVAVVGALVADRAAVLRWAADQMHAQAQRLTGEFNDSDILHEDGPAATVATWKRAADLLRRLAGEAHDTGTQQQDETETQRCDAGFVFGGRCAKPAGHRPPGSQDPHVPAPVAEQPAAATAYGNGKGRVYCVPCASKVGADVPLTIEDVDHWELCPSCGRHVIDVARTTEQQAAAADDEALREGAIARCDRALAGKVHPPHDWEPDPGNGMWHCPGDEPFAI